MPYGYVYTITNTCNGKVYVGQTTRTIHTRWIEHLEESNRKNYPLHRAIKKYGPDNFDVDEIAVAEDRSTLNLYETLIIECLRSTDGLFGYNLQLGGVGGKHTRVTRRKIAISQIKRFKERGHPRTGTVHSEDSKRKMSAAHSGMRNPNYPKNRRPFSPEYKQQISLKVTLWWANRKKTNVA